VLEHSVARQTSWPTTNDKSTKPAIYVREASDDKLTELDIV